MRNSSLSAAVDRPTLTLISNALVSGARETVLVFGVGWLGGFVYWQLQAPAATSPLERLGNVIVAALFGGLGGLTLLVGQVWVNLIGVFITLLRSNLVAAAAVLGAVAWETDVAVDLLSRTPLRELLSQPPVTIVVVVMLLGFVGAVAVFVPMAVVVFFWWLVRQEREV